MHSLLAFLGPRSMSPWMPLLDISMAMAVRARVIAHSHLFFLFYPHSEAPDVAQMHIHSPTLTLVPDVIWLQQSQSLTSVLYVSRISHTGDSDTQQSQTNIVLSLIYGADLQKKKNQLACLSSLFTSFLAKLCSVKHLAPIFWLIHFNQRIKI